MKRKLKVLFYGVTHEHAPGKLETLKRLGDTYEIAAVVDDRPGTGWTFQNETTLCEGFRIIGEAEVDAFLDANPVDVAFIEVANPRLLEIAAKFVERGIPMHCDKPCGEAMEPYRGLVERCREQNLPFQIGYMYRGNPALKWIWAFLAKGGLGELGFIEADMNHDYGLPAADYGRYLSQFRGGIFYNLACHLVDMVLPMTRGGLTEARLELGNAPGCDEGSKTSAFAVMKFGGTTVVLRTSAGMPGGILARRLRVDGSLGTIDLCPIERFDGGELKLILSLRGEAQREMTFGVQTDRYADQLLDLAAIVRGEKPNDQDYDRDLGVHEILLNAIAAEGR